METAVDVRAAEVVAFWREAGAQRWYKKDEAFDDQFRSRFLQTHESAASGELDEWQCDAQGALALLILLDQFPRNAFRETPRMFATDPQARNIARQAIAVGLDQQTDAALRNFFYLPLTHSERLADQDDCVRLVRALDQEDALKFARLHRDIIARFGRFPHRNPVLGRAMTTEEQAFLDQGGFAG